MAEGQDDSQKTEEPTQKRLDDAREKGQVAVSREVNHWFMILAGALAVAMLGPRAVADIGRLLVPFFEAPHLFPVDIGGFRGWLANLMATIGLALMPVLGLMMAAALAAGMVQTGILFAASSLKPKFERISPLQGLKRLFSLKAVTEFVKGLLKLVVVGFVAFWVLAPETVRIEDLVDSETEWLLSTIETLSIKLFATVLAVMTVIAALDLLYQRVSHHNQLRMSRQELRDELKQSEGDPIVKSRLRQLRLERARRRMMQEVPKADVVITNPTHFAVALRYEQATMAAPKLVAKGADRVAQKIREVATEHGVPIVENPPLARALFGVDLDAEVPPEHYKAVAEVISYVMKLRGAGAGARP